MKYRALDSNYPMDKDHPGLKDVNVCVKGMYPTADFPTFDAAVEHVQKWLGRLFFNKIGNRIILEKEYFYFEDMSVKIIQIQ